MHNKIYDKLKSFIVDSCKIIIFLLVLFFAFIYEFPYYIDTPGGLIDLEDRIDVSDNYESDGSINLAYVLELKATLPCLVMSKFKNDWSVIKKEEVIASNEEEKDTIFRDKMLLAEAKDNAVIVAYNKANKKLEINDNHIYVTYLDEDAKTDLVVGDEIIEVNGIKVHSKQGLLSIISRFKVGDILKIKTVNQNKYINKTATLKEGGGRPIIGIIITENKSLTTIPKIKFNFNGNESGPSGGLMMSLYIYNSLVEEDITKGLTLVGTGTIDENGNVGEIGGVEFKLKGAVKKHADVFFVPNGKNYKDAIKVKNKFSYDIDIVGVDTFDEALEYLANK